MQPLISSLPSKLIYSLQLLNGNPRSKNPPLHRNNTQYSKLSATVTPITLNPKKLRREPGRQEERGGRAHLTKAVKPGFLSWRFDAALNPKWSQSIIIIIIIKSQNPVFSEPKKCLITEAFVNTRYKKKFFNLPSSPSPTGNRLPNPVPANTRWCRTDDVCCSLSVFSSAPLPLTLGQKVPF
jgi:hypothetical protein